MATIKIAPSHCVGLGDWFRVLVLIRSAANAPRMSRLPYQAAASMGSPLMRGPWMGTPTFSSPLARSVAIVAACLEVVVVLVLRRSTGCFWRILGL